MGFPNRVDSATLSGGSWYASLPLNNLKNRTIGRVARTTNTALASTQFNIDFGRTRSTAIFGLINNNITLNGKYRLRATDEAAATNSLIWPRAPSNAIWSKLDVTAASSAVLGPDKLTTSEKLVESVVNTRHVTLQSQTLAAGTYTLTAVVKAAERTRFDLILHMAGASFDLTTLTASAPQTPTFPTDLSASAEIKDLGDGWYACSITGARPAGTALSRIVLSDGATTLYAGDGASGLYVWHTQLELGAQATSIIADAGGTQAVRPAGYMDNWQSYAFESGWSDVWTEIFPYPVLEWEDDRWWSGKYLEEDLAGSYRNLIVVLPTVYTLRYWRLEIDDTTNPAGYVQGGRVFFGPGWVPAKDPDFTLELGWETTTTVQPSLGGAETFDRRLSFRSTRFTFSHMTENEAMSQAFDMDRQAGIDQEILWVQNTADVAHQHRRRFLGRLRTLSPTQYPYYDNMTKAYEIKELL